MLFAISSARLRTAAIYFLTAFFTLNIISCSDDDQENNTLVTIDVPLDHFAPDETSRQFVFLNDENGRVIAHAEIQNGQMVKMKSSDFKGKYFYLTEAKYGLDYKSEPFLRLTTYPDIEAGAWVVDREYYPPASTVGNLNLEFVNGHPGESYICRDPSIYLPVFSSSLPHQQSISLYDSPTRLYVTRSNSSSDPEFFHLYPPMAADATETIDLGLVTTPMSSLSAPLPKKLDWAVSAIYASRSIDKHDHWYYVGLRDHNADDPEFKVIYPGNAFPSYRHRIVCLTEDYLLETGKSSFEIDFSLIPFNWEWNSDNYKATYSLSGSVYFASASNYDLDHRTGWTLILPKASGRTLNSIELPQQLRALVGTPKLVFSDSPGLMLLSYNSYSSYKDFVQVLRSSPASRDDYLWNFGDYKVMGVLSNELSGGRNQNDNIYFSKDHMMKSWRGR